MELLSTTTVTLPFARRRSNFNHTYFQNQPSLHRSHAQPLQRVFLPVLKSEGLFSSPSLLRKKSFVCKTSEMVTWVDKILPEWMQPYAKLGRIHSDVGVWLHSWPIFWQVYTLHNCIMLLC
jgi:hypothetical protein